jgi:hypothetical protein
VRMDANFQIPKLAPGLARLAMRTSGSAARGDRSPWRSRGIFSRVALQSD